MADQIKDHVERAKSDPTTENIEAMWRAVFMLQGWYFLPADPREGPNRPTVMQVDGSAWLVAFTNVRRLKEFARAQDRVDDDGEVHLLVLDPLESTNRILGYREEIAGVVFNPASDETFRAPIDALIAYPHHFDVPIETDDNAGDHDFDVS